MKFWMALFLFTLMQPCFSQTDASESTFALKNPDLKIDPYLQLQGWAVRSTGRSSQIDSDSGLDGVDSRTNFFFRRARLGFRGRAYQNLNFNISLYYDNLGHDSLASTRATTLPSTINGRSTDVTKGVAAVGLWDSFLTWKISQNDLLHITAGYFRPQISRESITSAFNVNSFEKSPSQNYVRQAVTGRGFGRATGLNMGGMKHQDNFGISYNLGMFNKLTTGGTNLGETQGDENSLVYVGRFSLTFGDPEMEKYGLAYNVNYFGKRKGLTLSINASTQEMTPTYKANHVVGGDVLFNWGAVNIDGEVFYLLKKGTNADGYARARTGHLRFGHNFYLHNGTILEPSFMSSVYYGENGSDYTGRDVVYDVGLNWYLDQNKYKFYAHYVIQEGDGKNLLHQDGPNGFHYGNYAGLGLTLQI